MSSGLDTKIPSVENEGVLHLQVTDFLYHRDDIVLNKLAKHDKIIVTTHGRPAFEVSLPPVFLLKRVDFSEAGALVKRNGIHYTQMQVFTNDRNWLEMRLDRGPDQIVVCWRGWPDFVMRKPSRAGRVEYPSLINHAERIRERLEEAEGAA